MALCIGNLAVSKFINIILIFSMISVNYWIPALRFVLLDTINRQFVKFRSEDFQRYYQLFLVQVVSGTSAVFILGVVFQSHFLKIFLLAASSTELKVHHMARQMVVNLIVMDFVMLLLFYYGLIILILLIYRKYKSLEIPHF